MNEQERLKLFNEKLEEFTSIEDFEVSARRAYSFKFGASNASFSDDSPAKQLIELLEEEVDELVAINLYQAINMLHPEPWKLKSWKTERLIPETPFDSLKRIVLGELLESGMLTDTDKVLELLDPSQDFEKLILSEVSEEELSLENFLKVESSIFEKLFALKQISFLGPDDRPEGIDAKLKSYSLSENHPGLSKKAFSVLGEVASGACDTDMILHALDALHNHNKEGGAQLLGKLLYSVEGYLRDDLSSKERISEGLIDALITESNKHTDVIERLREIAKDEDRPFAMLSAIAWLTRCKHADGETYEPGLSLLNKSDDPAVKAFAVRALGTAHGQLKGSVEKLKKYAESEGTDERLRRASYFALLSPRAGLGVSVREVLELYLNYLQHPGFDFFGDAVYSEHILAEAEFYVSGLTEIFDKIPDEQARKYAMQHFAKSFGFGLKPELKQWRPDIIKLMLSSFDRPDEQDLHYFVLWNILNGEKFSAEEMAGFSAGLKKRLAEISYNELSKTRIEAWLDKNES